MRRPRRRISRRDGGWSTTIVGVENPELKLRPGMTANASIIIAERSDVLRIPNAALRFRPPEDTVSPADTNAPGPLKSGVPRGENRRDRPRRKEAEGPRRQTVYLVSKEPASALGSSPRLRPVTATLGISDGGYTEVLDGLTEADVVATGTVNPVVAAAPTASPFGGGPFGGAPRPR